jgi:DNA-binding NarL/FixJ family response regulator
LVRSIPQIGRVEQAQDLSLALLERDESPPDLMLCDFASVQDDGLETLREVKARWPRVCCVLLVEDDRAYQRAQNAGVDAVLCKGVLAARLLEAIETLLPR